MGRNILTKTVEANNNINISNIQSGTYFVILKTKENILTQKLIKNR